MALEATHIRFALDVKDIYRVKDAQRYVCGAVYPDSRYVSKIARELTHPEDFMQWEVLQLDDFKKGWYSHLLYDKIQGQVTGEKFPSMASLLHHTQGTERWLRFTAIKILQDMEDVKKFAIAEYLPALDNAENPCEENIEKVKEYNLLFKILYADPTSITIESYRTVWKALGLEENKVSALESITQEYASNAHSKELITQMYAETLSRATTP